MVNPNRDLAQEALLAGNDPVTQRNRDMLLKRECPALMERLSQRFDQLKGRYFKAESEKDVVIQEGQQLSKDIKDFELRFMRSTDRAFVEEAFAKTTELLAQLDQFIVDVESGKYWREMNEILDKFDPLVYRMKNVVKGFYAITGQSHVLEGMADTSGLLNFNLSAAAQQLYADDIKRSDAMLEHTRQIEKEMQLQKKK